MPGDIVRVSLSNRKLAVLGPIIWVRSTNLDHPGSALGVFPKEGCEANHPSQVEVQVCVVLDFKFRHAAKRV